MLIFEYFFTTENKLKCVREFSNILFFLYYLEQNPSAKISQNIDIKINKKWWYNIKKCFGHKTIADPTKIDDIKCCKLLSLNRIRIRAQMHRFMGSVMDLLRNTFPQMYIYFHIFPYIDFGPLPLVWLDSMYKTYTSRLYPQLPGTSKTRFYVENPFWKNVYMYAIFP